jgi:AraC-like DNA-binding protein
LEGWRSHRAKWLAGLGGESGFQLLFDHIPGVAFFAKDREGHLLYASQALLARYGMADESGILGFKDHDINPKSMADAYVEDDARLHSGSAKVIERMELWWDLQGLPDWYLVTKIPLYARDGSCAGVAGILRAPAESERSLPVFQTVARAVEVIRRDYATHLRIEVLAEACGQSLRQLQRHFQRAFGLTPQEFLLKTRVIAAARLLENTSLSTGQIADSCGFPNTNAFGHHFRIRTGVTPAAYRKKVFGERAS